MNGQFLGATTPPTVEELLARAREGVSADEADRELRLMGLTDLTDLPDYIPDDENPNVLVRGRWLERGGSAWIVSTSGTGKSIHAMQLMLSFALGLPFAGLTPNRPLKCWYVQSEDSPTRLAIDRDDTTAELSERWADEVDPARWREAWKLVKFMQTSGVGAEFVDSLAMKLHSAAAVGALPDVVVINPFLAVVGGPITDGAYVTPFLRGGSLNGEHTDGLQRVLEEYGVGALIYHHTPKPPTTKELEGWLKSAFPEYQGAGSSDITNWGRSFITMMRVPTHPRLVCLTAGKNGADLGWDESGGGYRLYMAWSDSRGVSGGNRHAWREATDEEVAEVSKESVTADERDVAMIAEMVTREPMMRSEVARKIGSEMTDRRFRRAWNSFRDRADDFGLEGWGVEYGKPINEHVFYGVSEAAKTRAEDACRNWFEAHGVTGCHGVSPHKCHPVKKPRGDGVSPPKGGEHHGVTSSVAPAAGVTPCDDSDAVRITTEELQI